MSKQQPQRPGQSATTTQITHLYSSGTLSYEVARERLGTLGFEHTNKLPASGSGRIPARGKGASNTSAAIQWTDDRQALHWYDFTTDEHGTIFADQQPLRPQQTDIAKLKDQAKASKQQANIDRQAKQVRAARQARELYSSGSTAGIHPYITSKCLSGLHNARIDRRTGELLVPMQASGKGIVNLQRIRPNGQKRFLSGGRVFGACSLIGALHCTKRVFVCEGWATGVSLHDKFGLPVVAALNAGNLMPVCRALRSLSANLKIVVAGDDDRQNQVNTGRQKAIEAATAVHGALLFPELCKCCNCTDWNDLTACARRCDRG